MPHSVQLDGEVIYTSPDERGALRIAVSVAKALYGNDWSYTDCGDSFRYHHKDYPIINARLYVLFGDADNSSAVIPAHNWSAAWPVIPGRYWFYGYIGRPWPGDKLKLYAGEVSLSAGGSPMYFVEGHFMYKSEGAFGYWLPLTEPTPPAFDLIPED